MTAVNAQENTPGVIHKGSVLVVDDAQFCREMVAAALRGSGYRVVPAVDGCDALRLLAEYPADMAIIDYNMPRMDGVELLRALRGNPKYQRMPVIMLTDVASKEVIVRVGALGVAGYMLKSKFSLPELLGRVGKAFKAGHASHAASAVRSAAPADAAAPEAAAPAAGSAAAASIPAPVISRHMPAATAPNLITREAALPAVKDFAGVKALNILVAELHAALSAPAADLEMVASLIQQDPVLAMRTLVAAQATAAQGKPPRLNSIEDAIRAIGIPGVRTILDSCPVFDPLSLPIEQGVALIRRWQHLQAVGSILTRILPKTEAIPAGLPYIIGLIHELPDILLEQHFPGEMTAASDFATQVGAPVRTLFQSVFGVAIDELAGLAFDGAKIPPAIVSPVLEFARAGGSVPQAGAQRPALSRLAKTLAVADAYAHALLMATSKDATVQPMTEHDCRSALITNAPINGPEVRSEVVTTMCTQLKAPAEFEKALIEPLFPPRAVRVLYARHPAFSRLDPLETALSQLGKVQTLERAPRAADWDNVGGLVVASPDAEAARSLVSEAIRVQKLAGVSLPILCVVPGEQHAATVKAIGKSAVGEQAAATIAGYPVSLFQLAQFIGKLKSP